MYASLTHRTTHSCTAAQQLYVELYYYSTTSPAVFVHSVHSETGQSIVWYVRLIRQTVDSQTVPPMSTRTAPREYEQGLLRLLLLRLRLLR